MRSIKKLVSVLMALTMLVSMFQVVDVKAVSADYSVNRKASDTESGIIDRINSAFETVGGKTTASGNTVVDAEVRENFNATLDELKAALAAARVTVKDKGGNILGTFPVTGHPSYRNDLYEELKNQLGKDYAPNTTLFSGKTYTLHGLADLHSIGDPELSATETVYVKLTISPMFKEMVDSTITVEVKAGTSLDQFKSTVNAATKLARVRLTDNSVVQVPIFIGLASNTYSYSSYYEMFESWYRYTYNPNDTSVRQYVMEVSVDLSNYGVTNKRAIAFIIKVTENKTIKSVDNIEIKINSGVSEEQFKAAVNAVPNATVRFNDNTTVSLKVYPIYRASTQTRYSSFYEEFTAKYPGKKGYDKNKTTTQNFEITGHIDLSPYGKLKDTVVTIKIIVGAAKKVTKIEPITINVENGISLTEFMSTLNSIKKTTIKFEDGTTSTIDVTPGFVGSSSNRYATFYDQLHSIYGERSYSPDNKNAQTYIIFGNIDLTKYNGTAKNDVQITVNVSARKEATVTFDGNGGEYYGDKTMKVKIGSSYGFTYVPSYFIKEDYLFEGWYTEPVGGDRVWAGTICTKDITLYAHWRKVFCGKSWGIEAKSWKKGCLTVEWETILTKVNGYEIAISTDKKNWTISAAPFSRVKYFTGLKSGKTYYVKVRGFRYDSVGKKIYGVWSDIEKRKVK